MQVVATSTVITAAGGANLRVCQEVTNHDRILNARVGRHDVIASFPRQNYMSYSEITLKMEYSVKSRSTTS